MNLKIKKPKFSIILPTHNRGGIIKSAIESVINQSFKDWELLIIDNASNDNTKKVVSQYCDMRIKYHHYEELVPLNENWERAINLVKGEFFVVLGDDDFFCKNLLEEVNSVENYSDLIVVNSASFTSYDPVGKIKNILFLSDYSGHTYKFDPIEVSKNYQTFNLKALSVSISQLHPSVFFFRSDLVLSIKRNYSGFYKAFYPDWIAHTLFGLYAKCAVFIDKPLVVIGGVDTKYYCYTNSKDNYFGLRIDSKYVEKINEIEKDLPKLVSFFTKYKQYPYFSGRIITQLLLNLLYIKEVDEDKYKIVLDIMMEQESNIEIKLYENLKDNYFFCRKIGDGKLIELEKDVEFLNFQNNKLKRRLKVFFNSIFLNENAIISKIYVFIINLLKRKGSWAIIHSGDISDCEKAIDDA